MSKIKLYDFDEYKKQALPKFEREIINPRVDFLNKVLRGAEKK